MQQQLKEDWASRRMLRPFEAEASPGVEAERLTDHLVRDRERETTAVPSTPTQLQDSSTDTSDEDQAVLSAEQAKAFPKELPPWFGDSLRMQAIQNKKDFKKILKKKI